mgnify:CR=1 FL=1
MGHVFDDKKRTYQAPADETESTYHWLDRSALEMAAAARDELERLYDQYPDPHRRLLANLRAEEGRDADNAFFGAFASLVLYDRWVRRGYRITVDEAIGGHERRPDMQLMTDSGPIVVEVGVLCTKSDWAEREWCNGQLVDAINAGVRVEGWLLGIDIDGGLPDGCPHEEVVAAVQDAVDALPSPREVSSEYENLPRCYLRHPRADSSLELTFFPLEDVDNGPDELGFIDDRVIGVGPGNGGCPDTERRVRNKLRSKHPARYPPRYVDDKPYVIALAGTDAFMQRKSVGRSLYGDESLVLPSADATEGWRVLRKGLFGPSPDGAPKQSRISGVLWVEHLGKELWYPGSIRLAYFPNPFSKVPVDASLLGIDDELLLEPQADGRYLLKWRSGEQW